jgi:hypothetical protein
MQTRHEANYAIYFGLHQILCESASAACLKKVAKGFDQ